MDRISSYLLLGFEGTDEDLLIPFGLSGDANPPIPPVVVTTGQSGGAHHGKGGRKRRVFIRIDGRELWFKNEENARDYLEQRGEEIVEKFEQEAKRVEADVASEVKERVTAPDWKSIPIRIPKIEVSGSEELESLARDIETKFYAVLMALKQHEKRLLEEEYILLLS